MDTKLLIPKSECAFDISCKVCSTPDMQVKMHHFYTEKTGNKATNIIEDMKKLLKVTSEAAIYDEPEFVNYVGYGDIAKEKELRFRPEGPADSVDLLDNYNIDDTLEQLSRKMIDFKHIHFQMIDFMQTKSELATIFLPALYQEGYRTLGVVLNTDHSQGRGKHWFACFVDMRPLGTPKEPWTIEYFNSSGNPPLAPVHAWIRQQIAVCASIGHRAIPIYSSRQLQYSNTECGVWSLVYIYSRLKGKPHSWMNDVRMDDKDMIKYRERIFRPKTHKKLTKVASNKN
jgi:hypothetical protein